MFQMRGVECTSVFNGLQLIYSCMLLMMVVVVGWRRYFSVLVVVVVEYDGCVMQ